MCCISTKVVLTANKKYMPSDTYCSLRKEMKERNKSDKLTKKQVVLLELQLKKDLPQVCAQCGKTENLSLDHIVPQYLLQDLGVDTNREIIEDNYQVLCKICNGFKSHRLDARNPKTKEILIRLLNKL